MKRIDKITKLTDSIFLNLYEEDAVRRDGGKFKYFFASRLPEKELRAYTHSTEAEGISLFAVYGEEHDKVVLIREYRYPINDYVYDIPAGLIEKNEEPETAAVREFREETGLEFSVYSGGCEAMRKPAFSSVGLTDETISVAYGFAAGQPDERFMEASEDISTVIAGRAELFRIIKEERITARAMFLIMLFLNSVADDPFGFLNEK